MTLCFRCEIVDDSMFRQPSGAFLDLALVRWAELDPAEAVAWELERQDVAAQQSERMP
ncbi:MAG: hypothetical protein KDN22_04220 [Verrucomicrobiae bacterium]|nr:hypothetical protein [Verrucomicrobiae bacterium]